MRQEGIEFAYVKREALLSTQGEQPSPHNICIVIRGVPDP